MISLNGNWQLAFFPEAESPVKHPDDLISHAGQTISAQVPGNVELDLQRAGVIPDPFYAGNIRRLRPYEFYEWWYTKTFEVSATSKVLRRWELVFAGLDTLATVWLNGVEIGRAANALIEHRFDVTDALRPGTNCIVVRLGSAVNHARQFSYDAASMSWELREEGLFIRKAPHVWGWDIMPRAVSAGIWRSVWIDPFRKGLVVSSRVMSEPYLDTLLKFLDWAVYSEEGMTLNTWGIAGLTFEDTSTGKVFLPHVKTPKNAGGTLDIVKEYGFDLLFNLNENVEFEDYKKPPEIVEFLKNSLAANETAKLSPSLQLD